MLGWAGSGLRAREGKEVAGWAGFGDGLEEVGLAQLGFKWLFNLFKLKIEFKFEL